MTNLLVNPRIGLLFLVPGMNETLRINGIARITDDARLLAPSAVNNRPPKVGLVVKIEEALPALRQGADPIRALGCEQTYRAGDPAHLRADAA